MGEAWQERALKKGAGARPTDYSKRNYKSAPGMQAPAGIDFEGQALPAPAGAGSLSRRSRLLSRFGEDSGCAAELFVTS
jgi:hypothetical protein